MLKFSAEVDFFITVIAHECVNAAVAHESSTTMWWRRAKSSSRTCRKVDVRQRIQTLQGQDLRLTFLLSADQRLTTSEEVVAQMFLWLALLAPR